MAAPLPPVLQIYLSVTFFRWLRSLSHLVLVIRLLGLLLVGSSELPLLTLEEAHACLQPGGGGCSGWKIFRQQSKSLLRKIPPGDRLSRPPPLHPSENPLGVVGVQLDPVVEAAKGTPLLGTPTNAREDDRAVQLDGNILVLSKEDNVVTLLVG